MLVTFKKTTVAGILSAFTRTLSQLDDLAVARQQAADSKASEILDLEESMNTDLAECAKAISVSNRLHNLLS